MGTYNGNEVCTINTSSNDEGYVDIINDHGNIIDFPFFVIARTNSRYCIDGEVYRCLDIKQNIDDYDNVKLVYESVKNMGNLKTMPIRQVYKSLLYLINGWEDKPPIEYEVTKEYMYKGKDLMGKVCSIVKPYSNSPSHVFVEFKEDIGGGSADGAGKCGHCILLEKILLKKVKVKPKETDKNVAKKVDMENILGEDEDVIPATPDEKQKKNGGKIKIKAKASRTTKKQSKNKKAKKDKPNGFEFIPELVEMDSADGVVTQEGDTRVFKTIQSMDLYLSTGEDLWGELLDNPFDEETKVSFNIDNMVRARQLNNDYDEGE